LLDQKNYIEIQKGNIPLIISVPHGGALECENIPKRSQGILGRDGRTIEIAKILVERINLLLKKQNLENNKSSYIISNVHRSRIDMNRDETEAFNPNSDIAREIYNSYHNNLMESVRDNLKLLDHSLLIDIHGFEKKNRPSGYRDVDIILGTNNFKTLFLEPILRKDWGNNIRGKIIKKFLELEIPIAPGNPKRREYVLTGGYITKKYGASQVPKSQAIQIEFSDKIRLQDQKLRELVLNSLAEIFVKNLI